MVETCCLKTHRFGGHFTMPLKNSVGAVAASSKGSSYDYMREFHSSPFQRLMIAEINAFTGGPDLVLMDVARGFVTGCPGAGDAAESGLLLGSSDSVVDAVGVAILRYYGTTHEVSPAGSLSRSR